jgi:hypothetical protein
MKDYMLFFMLDQETEASPEEIAKVDCVALISEFVKGLMDQGKVKSCHGLDPNGSLFVARKGKVIDGPFAETKELVLGFIEIRAEDDEDAKQIAASTPTIHYGFKVELRPIFPMLGFEIK